VDLDAYRLRLLESPWVASAELWRVLPSTIHVRIVERVPLAIARLEGGQLYLVDAAGVIMDRYGPAYVQYDLPVVDGLLAAATPGATADAGRVQLVERLIRDLSGRQDLFRIVSQVDVSDSRNAIVLIEGDPARLYLGDERFRERLEHWLAVAKDARAQDTFTDHVDLRYGDFIYGK
jgi:cell division septal protein FtsQ